MDPGQEAKFQQLGYGQVLPALFLSIPGPYQRVRRLTKQMYYTILPSKCIILYYQANYESLQGVKDPEGTGWYRATRQARASVQAASHRGALPSKCIILCYMKRWTQGGMTLIYAFRPAPADWLGCTVKPAAPPAPYQVNVLLYDMIAQIQSPELQYRPRSSHTRRRWGPRWKAVGVNYLARKRSPRPHDREKPLDYVTSIGTGEITADHPTKDFAGRSNVHRLT
jgi:hypothetical protein